MNNEILKLGIKLLVLGYTLVFFGEKVRKSGEKEA